MVDPHHDCWDASTTIHPRRCGTTRPHQERDRRAPAPCTARRASVRPLLPRTRTRRTIHACTTSATTGRPVGTAAATMAPHTNIPWWNASTNCWKRSDKAQVQRYVHPHTTRHDTTRHDTTARRRRIRRWIHSQPWMHVAMENHHAQRRRKDT